MRTHGHTHNQTNKQLISNCNTHLLLLLLLPPLAFIENLIIILFHINGTHERRCASPCCHTQTHTHTYTKETLCNSRNLDHSTGSLEAPPMDRLARRRIRRRRRRREYKIDIGTNPNSPVLCDLVAYAFSSKPSETDDRLAPTIWILVRRKFCRFHLRD